MKAWSLETLEVLILIGDEGGNYLFSRRGLC